MQHNNTDHSPRETHSQGLAGKLTALFLRNGKISALTLLLLSFWGVLSFILLPKQYNPEIVAPAFVVVTEFPGASAQETRELLTRRIEDALAELQHIDDITSQSSADGKSAITVKFIVGSSQENAVIALNQKLQDIKASLPQGISEPIVQSISPDDVPILDIGLSSHTLSESSLRKLAIDIIDELKTLPGVSKVEVKGGRVNHIQIEINAAALAARGLSLSEVISILSQANGSQSVDTLASANNDPLVSVSSSIQNADDLARTVLREEQGNILRLEDIARVSYGPGDITEYVRVAERDNSLPTVHIAFSKLKGENISTVSQAILNTLEDSKKRIIPDDVSVSVLRDEGRTASEEISKLTLDLVKSIVIVGVLLALFLGLRNALVASVSIPLVLLAVFGVGLLAGQTVNRITLFALILSLGLLVDDAIVVVENIARYFRLYPNENRSRLIVRAVDEVGGALFLSTVTMAIVFLPMAFVTGMMGPYMGPIPFFVPTALFASLIISVTLNPFLASLFTLPVQGKHEKKGIFLRALENIELIYTKTLDALLHNRYKRNLTLGLTAAVLLIAFLLPFTPLVPFRMLPKADKEQFYVSLDLPDGSSVETTNKTVQALESTLLSDQDITAVESFIGTSQVIDFNGLFRGSSTRTGEHQATLKVDLVHPNERDETSESIAFRVRTALNEFQKSYPDATLRIVEDPPGPPVISTFFLSIKGENDTLRERVAQDIQTQVESIEGVVDLDTSLPEHRPDYVYRVRFDKAQMLGISPQAINETLRAAFSGSPIGLYHETARPDLRKAEQEYIIVRFARENRDSAQDLSLLKLPSRSGNLVPLTEVVESVDRPIERVILNDNRIKATTLSAEMGDRSVIYAVLDLFPKLLDYTLPNGNGRVTSWSAQAITYEDQTTHERVTVEIEGEWKLTLEVFRDLGIAMAAGIFLVFFILAMRTKSFLVPTLIMVSIPLGLIGILPGFAFLHAIKGTYFNATSMIGVIALSGLSVKNAVIYLEYLEPLKNSGKSLREALVETGRIRLLPIVLTSLAAIFGSLTIVSDPVWEGLAWSIIFGLLASTLLTLIVFPLLYFVFERKHWEQDATLTH